MFGSLSVAVTAIAFWGIPLLVVAFLLYLVVRRGVRDGMLDARRIDAEEAAERRARAMRSDAGASASAASPGAGNDTGTSTGTGTTGPGAAGL
ncbi:hypothetical protein MHY85_17635 [Cellulomonas sp. ACRRI]|uniref:hypothetical protein n=1 Tax=Cellulomonas sp. ACRRI TaxID=2918188 RepID=UPI001EF25110|nr:hypothetical protein [Cellulomonas sp. ACRRI]MCG7287790.1 hypothetical protein [Cellulomonas sp. ACRRI]